MHTKSNVEKVRGKPSSKLVQTLYRPEPSSYGCGKDFFQLPFPIPIEKESQEALQLEPSRLGSVATLERGNSFLQLHSTLL